VREKSLNNLFALRRLRAAKTPPIVGGASPPPVPPPRSAKRGNSLPAPTSLRSGVRGAVLPYPAEKKTGKQKVNPSNKTPKKFYILMAEIYGNNFCIRKKIF